MFCMVAFLGIAYLLTLSDSVYPVFCSMNLGNTMSNMCNRE